MRATLTTATSGTLLGVALLVGAAGCAGTGDGTPAPGGTAGATAAATTPATASSEPAGRMTRGLAQPLVLERTGGVAGVQDRLVVNPDGTLVVSTKDGAPASRQLSERELAVVVSAVKAADLQNQPSPTAPPTAEPDRFRYTVTAEGRTVSMSETTAPPGVRALLAVVEPLLNPAAPTP